MITPGEMNKIFNKINPILESLNDRIKKLEEKTAENKKPPAQKQVDKKQI